MNTPTETRHHKPVSTRAHGLLDYPIGLALLFAPNIFGFADVGGAAVWVPRLVGIITLVQSVFTRYELGLVKLLPMRMHLITDYVVGIFLAVSPWLFGFYNELVQRVWLPHLVVGLAIILITAMTEKYPRQVDVTHRGPAHA